MCGHKPNKIDKTSIIFCYFPLRRDILWQNNSRDSRDQSESLTGVLRWLVGVYCIQMFLLITECSPKFYKIFNSSNKPVYGHQPQLSGAHWYSNDLLGGPGTLGFLSRYLVVYYRRLYWLRKFTDGLSCMHLQ